MTQQTLCQMPSRCSQESTPPSTQPAGEVEMSEELKPRAVTPMDVDLYLIGHEEGFKQGLLRAAEICDEQMLNRDPSDCAIAIRAEAEK